jgi:hypothetical protein
LFEVGWSEVILLEVDTGETVDLKVDQGRCQPGELVGLLGDLREPSDSSGFMVEGDRTTRAVVPPSNGVGSRGEERTRHGN